MPVVEIRHSFITPKLFYNKFLVQSLPLKIFGGCENWRACSEESGWGNFDYIDVNFGNNPFYPTYVNSNKILNKELELIEPYQTSQFMDWEAKYALNDDAFKCTHTGENSSGQYW